MKKTNDDINQFSDWSYEWKTEGRKKIDVDKILKLWNQRMPRHWERKIWDGELGFRKRTTQAGEKKIEKQLFDSGAKGFRVSFLGRETKSDYRVEGIYHNMPLANQGKGQVIADAFGVLDAGISIRPLFIEVKVAANDPWFALVENLQQVRLARACARKIQDFVHKNSKYQVERGIWGLVLAPREYYKKHAIILAKCKPLLTTLKEKTRARVAFGITDSLQNGEIKIIDSNWSV